MKRMLLVGVVASLAFGGFAEEEEPTTGPIITGTELRLHAKAGESATYSVAIPTDITTLRKTGGGTYTLGVTNTFAGTTTVEAGTLKGFSAAFGKPSVLEVKDGAGIEVTDNLSINSAVKVKIIGVGPDGQGALRYSNTASMLDRTALSSLELLGDATITFTGERVCFATMTLSLNGHTLTKNGAGQLDFRGGKTTFSGVGNLRIAQGTLNCECSTFVHAGEGAFTDIPWTVAKDAVLMFYYGYMKPFPFPLHCEDGSYFKCGHWSGFGMGGNIIGQPITVDGTLNFRGHSDALTEDININGGFTGDNAKLLFPNGKYRMTATIGGSVTSTVHSLCVSNLSTVVLADKVNFGTTGWFELMQRDSTVGAVSTLVITNEAKLLSRGADSVLRIGEHFRKGARAAGLMKIEGGVVSNKVLIGTSGGLGAVYQNGGEFIIPSGSGMGSTDQGYAFICVNDGVCRILDPNFKTVGWGQPRAFFWQKGGEVIHDNTGTFNTGWGNRSYSHYRQSGGTSIWKSRFALAKDVGINEKNCRSIFTIDGTAVADMGQKDIVLYATTNETGVTLMVNFNGGTAKMAHIGRSSKSWVKWADICDLARKAGRFYINFNGGTLVTTTKDKGFFWDQMTRVTVWEKGATIDTDGNDVTWSQALQAPSGKGLKSVTMHSYTNNNQLLGPAQIYLKGTNIQSADAMMDYDTLTRKVTGVTITCPGNDLGSDVEVRYDRWYPWYSDNDSEKATFELQDNPTTGGLTKKGAGTLTLSAANTYGGTTRVEGGTLSFTAAAGYPGGSLEFSAEALRSRAVLVKAYRMAFASGSKIRITDADTLDATDFLGLANVVTLTEPLAALPEVEYVDGEGRAITPKGNWSLRLSGDGKRIRFGALRGLFLFVK